MLSIRCEGNNQRESVGFRTKLGNLAVKSVKTSTIKERPEQAHAYFSNRIVLVRSMGV
jgi:hypothetical protein